MAKNADGIARLAETPIDYRATMLWFAKRQQNVWFNFTWMVWARMALGQEAAQTLQAYREAVAGYLA